MPSAGRAAGTPKPEAQAVAWVYMLECRDGSLYTGATLDLERRLAAHQAGKGARYTSGRRPVRLTYAIQCPTLGDALRREAEIKRLSRSAKQGLASKWQSQSLWAPG